MLSSSKIPATIILNVDDYPISRNAISLILKQEGFASIEIENGAEALRYVAEAQPGPALPDLVLLDVKLPDTTGYEVCRRLKQDPATAAIPVLMISGVCNRVEDKTRGLDSGADGYLIKPVESAELIATIKALLRMRQAQEERARLLEREQQALAQAEAVNRIKDEFLSRVSRELQEPLNTILGWTRLLSRKALSLEDVEYALKTIERSALAQSRTINDLLDVSQMLMGKLRLDVRSFDPIPVIQGAIDMISPAAEAKEVFIAQDFDTSAGEIRADPDRLHQIIWNLVSNAVKFTPPGGEVMIQVKRSRPHLCSHDQPEMDEIEIVVQDSGVGIDPAFLPDVFDPFRPADGSRGRKNRGLGLGLAIVRRLAELHGGAAIAESQGENKGATFKVRMPAVSGFNRAEKAIEALATVRGCDPVPELSPKLAGVRILVVDDEPDCAALTGYLLNHWGADVRTVFSATEALEFFEPNDNWRPDILVSDIQMPGIDGYALIRKVREIESDLGKNTPAIALTAYTRPEDRIRALDAGFHIHIAKPVEPVELLAVVENLSTWKT